MVASCKPNDAGGSQRNDRADHPLRQGDARGCGNAGEQKTLDDELPHQPAAPGAERGPDGEFALPLHASREEQTGDIGAADHQNERDRREHDQQRQLQITHQMFTERDHLDTLLLVG